MQHAVDRSTLPDGFTRLSVEDAVRTLLRAHVFDVQTLTILEQKHKALVDYIEALEQ